MSAAVRRRARGANLLVESGNTLARCLVCGGSAGWPPMPIRARAFQRYLEFLMELHADCDVEDRDTGSPGVLVMEHYERRPGPAAAAAAGVG